MRWLARATLALLAVAWADDCHDRNIDCSDWAEEGECDSDEMRDWMAKHCPVSCRKCKQRPRAPSRASLCCCAFCLLPAPWRAARAVG